VKKIPALCALLVLVTVTAARGEENAPAPSAYQRVMQAQYAARTTPEPARPEEAQRIYDPYLKSIGQPARDNNSNSTDAGGNTGVPSR